MTGSIIWSDGASMGYFLTRGVRVKKSTPVHSSECLTYMTAEGQGTYSLSLNVLVHLCPTGGGWHPTRASATCACASSVYTQTSAVAVLKGHAAAMQQTAGPNIVLNASANNLALMRTHGGRRHYCSPGYPLNLKRSLAGHNGDRANKLPGLVPVI